MLRTLRADFCEGQHYLSDCPAAIASAPKNSFSTICRASALTRSMSACILAVAGLVVDHLAGQQQLGELDRRHAAQDQLLAQLLHRVDDLDLAVLRLVSRVRLSTCRRRPPWWPVQV